MRIRTRVAPSPTGDPHVGTAYMALFNWAFAKSQGGEFVLRIEDTDQARSSEASEARILAALNWLDLPWDEGPDIGGPHGPYRQSERTAIYQRHAQQLIDQGQAFHCFCTAERLATMRAEQRAAGAPVGYDGRCLNLSADEVSAKQAAGETSVVRMRVPDSGECCFIDELRGEIAIPCSQIDMQVLLKADGFPTYHLAVVVDDHLMGITHILRGEEWINSTPKHKLLFDYFGWPMPTLAHLPLLRNPDQSKLSKRRNPTSIDYFRDVGYLPEALTNYLALMGFSMPDEREIFSKAEFLQAFSLDRVSLGGPIFDFEKLNWLNGQHIRGLDADAFMDRLEDWAINRQRLAPLTPLIQTRTERFADIPAQVDYLLGDRRPLSEQDFTHKKLSREQVVEVLFRTAQAYDALAEWRQDELLALCKANAERMGLSLRDFLAPLFIAISGRAVALPLFESMAFLGADITRVRLREALDALGLSNKQRKRLEKLTG